VQDEHSGTGAGHPMSDSNVEEPGSDTTAVGVADDTHEGRAKHGATPPQLEQLAEAVQVGPPTPDVARTQGSRASLPGADSESVAEAVTPPVADGGPAPAARSRRTAKVALLAVLVVAVGAAGLVRWAPWAGLPQDAAFRVGDRVVTEAAVQRRTDVLRALYGVQVPEDAAGLDRFRRDTAKAMAISLVLDDAARAQDIRIADKTVSDALDRFLLQRYPQGGRAAYVQALGAQGVGEKDVLAEIRRQLEVRDLFDRTTDEVEVTDAELQAMFSADPATYAVPERRQVRHIVVAEQAVAQAVLRRLRAGQDLTAVAAQTSLDTSTKDKGGELGLLTAAELDPAFAAAAFAVPARALFGPVQTSLGWHLGRVDRVVPSAPSTFEQVRDQLRQQQETERAVAVWRDHVIDLVVDADVEYAADYRPADPEPDLGVPTPPAASTVPTATPPR
jgi:peptidyl-prolyl cis-trans isomerase C